MEITVTNQSATHLVVSPQASIGVTLEASPELMNLLSGSLYKNPTYAMVREVMCNAHDAHIEADAKKLAMAVAGKYPAPDRETDIGGPKGTELQFSGESLHLNPHTKQKAPKPEPEVDDVDESLGSNVEDFHEDAPVAPIDVQEVIQQLKPVVS